MAVNILYPKHRRSEEGRETEAAIERESLPKDKPVRVKAHFTARRDVFLKKRNMHGNFTNKDAADDAPLWLRSAKDAFKDQWIFRRESDRAVQAVRSLTGIGTQTPFYRRVTVAIQAEPSMVDARVENGREDGAAGNPEMKKFFDKVLPRVMHHLTQNNAIPIFGDDYVNLTEDDTFVGSREENFLREAGNFTHQFMREKQITSIDWRPGKSVVAVSVMSQASMAERLEAGKDVDNAVCIVWSLADQAVPQYILDSPAEVVCLKFCPTKPDLIIGGLANGQVALWNINVQGDTKSRHGKHANRLRPQQNGNEDVTSIPAFDPPVPGQTLEKSGDHMVWRLKPAQLSRIEYSHRRPVQDICWLPADCECNFDGTLTEPTEGQNQFATISEDGVMFIWDMRPLRQPEQKIKRLKTSKGVPGESVAWVPLLKWAVSRPDGSGDLIGLRIHLECKNAEGEPDYLMCCTSAEGEFATCFWGPKDEARQRGAPGFEADTRREARMMRSLAEAHAGPAWALHRHPALPEYYLTVGDWSFKIWKIGLNTPILSSPMGESHFTCGRWSPTRPAVLFVGTGDGSVQVWDLLDRSHEKLFVTQVTGQEAITTLEFKPVNDRRQSVHALNLAVGTKQGYVHLYELPKKLVKSHPSELRLTKQFFERESRRVAYFSWRWKERSKEMDSAMHDRGGAGEAAKGGARGAEDSNGLDENDEYMATADDDKDFLELVAKLNGEEESA